MSREQVVKDLVQSLKDKEVEFANELDIIELKPDTIPRIILLLDILSKLHAMIRTYEYYIEGPPAPKDEFDKLTTPE